MRGCLGNEDKEAIVYSRVNDNKKPALKRDVNSKLGSYELPPSRQHRPPPIAENWAVIK